MNAHYVPTTTRGRRSYDLWLPKTIAAARELLVEKGYEGASARAIGENLGRSVMAIYSLFPNLDALVAAVFDEELEAYTLQASELQEHPKANAKINLAALFAIDYQYDRLALLRIQIGLAYLGRPVFVAALNRRSNQLLDHAIDLGFPAFQRDGRHAFQAIWSAHLDNCRPPNIPGVESTKEHMHARLLRRLL